MPVKPFRTSNQRAADTKAAGGGCGQTSREWQADIYRWQELAQVSFLSWQMFWQMWQTCVCHGKTCPISRQKYACCNKTFVVADTFLSQQNLSQQIFLVTNIILLWENFCHGKLTFVMTNMCLSQLNMSFVMTKVCLSRQQFCSDRHVFVMTKVFFCHDKHNFVVTKVLLWQAYSCHDKRCVCHDKHVFVTTKLLSCQQLFLWQLSPMIQCSAQRQ